MSLEQSVIAALRLENTTEVDQEEGWELWKYGVRDPVSQTQVPHDSFLLFIKAKGLTKSRDPGEIMLKLRSLRARLRGNAMEGKLNVIVQRSSSIANNLDAVQRELGARSVKLMSELLQEQCQYLLGDARNRGEQFAYFVEPTVEDKLALTKLEDWLLAKGDEAAANETSAEGDKSSIAVLLAPAGMGKTSVARELARHLKSRRERDVLPILIEPSQWSSLNPSEEPTLWSLIEHALKWNGFNPVPKDIFYLFAQTGYITTIFDGLDELGSIRRGTITPVDVVGQLRNLTVGSDCRILLTSREGLWSELVPEEFRRDIREFQLQPFRRQEIAKYREKRFPNPKLPARERFDRILSAVTNVVHPETTAKVPHEERALGTPLILHLIATEAEEYSEEPDQYGLKTSQYKNPLYAITYGILYREHELRKLCLTPAQQFLMISSLVVEMGKGPYSWEDVLTTAEDAFEDALPKGQQSVLKSHALLRPAGGESFVFRFEYLGQFAPAVWVCDYVLNKKRDPIVEKYLRSISGRSSPVSAFVAELLRERSWKVPLIAHMDEIRLGDANHRAIGPFFWEVAQSLLPPPGEASRSARTSTMSEIFGNRGSSRLTFSGLLFSGPVVYMDCRQTLFKGCTFQNCEWINCEAGSDTQFEHCNFKGRFVSVQSAGLRSAQYDPLTEENVDPDTRADIASLLNRPHLLSISEDAVSRIVTSVLQPFRGAGFFVPRSREYLNAMFIEPAIVRDYVLEQLLESDVLDEQPGRGLQMVKKNSASVIALLDNGTRNGAVKAVINKAVSHFRHNPRH